MNAYSTSAIKAKAAGDEALATQMIQAFAQG